MTDDAARATLQDAARAALAARSGGPAVAVVRAVPAPGRLLVFEDGTVQGGFADHAVQQRALEMARHALDDGVAASEAVEPDTDAGEPAPSGAGSVTLYVEAHHPVEELVIVGAGHIAVPLARLGVLLGFRVVVLDDREAFATTERFPDAAEVRRVDFADPFAGHAFGPRSYLVLVTRAHRYDYDCLMQLLSAGHSYAYLGMVGSRRRVRATFESLQEQGIPRERLATVHSPIGLDIGARTPEEIAVSIAAELVAVRRRAAGTAAASLGGKERVLERLVAPAAKQREAPAAKQAPPGSPNKRPEPAATTSDRRSSIIDRRSSAAPRALSDPEAVVYAALLDAIEAAEAGVLATVVDAKGSTPRDAGSKMLIAGDGTLVGTIGGGCGEGDVIAAAREVVETGEPRVVRVDLMDDIDGWSPAICGGVMEVLLESIEPIDAA